MRKIILSVLAFSMVAAVAHAQPPRGRPPGGGGRPAGAPAPAGRPASNQIVLTGVVLAVDFAADRVTIAYDPCEALNWPAGAMPFAMDRSGMLGDIQVKQKVRFRLANHRIAEFLAPVALGADGDPAPSGERLTPPPPAARLS